MLWGETTTNPWASQVFVHQELSKSTYVADTPNDEWKTSVSSRSPNSRVCWGGDD